MKLPKSGQCRYIPRLPSNRREAFQLKWLTYQKISKNGISWSTILIWLTSSDQCRKWLKQKSTKMRVMKYFNHCGDAFYYRVFRAIRKSTLLWFSLEVRQYTNLDTLVRIMRIGREQYSQWFIVGISTESYWNLVEYV